MYLDEQKIKLLACTTALLLCFSGCAPAEPVSQNQTTGTQAQMATVYSGANATNPSEAVSETESAPTDETRIVVSEQNGTSTNVTTTAPDPVTDPLAANQAQTVLQQTILLMQSQLPNCEYDSTWSGGTEVPLPVGPELSLDEMANDLVAKLKEMFEYQSVTCIYNLTYAGIADDGINHKFVFSYIFERPNIPPADFDSQTVVNRVTQNVLNSNLGVTLFDGSNAKKTISLTDVPLFYTTDRSVEYLTDTIVWMIQSSNLAKPVYTQFKLAFVSAGETSYEFVLYLK